MIVLLTGIGFMGGTGWSGRVAWAAAALLVSAGIIFLIFGPGYDSFVKSGPAYDAFGLSDLDGLREDALKDISESSGDFPDTSRLAANKVFDMLESEADDLASGIASSSLNFAIIGLLALLGTIFRSTIVGAARRVLPSRGQDPPE